MQKVEVRSSMTPSFFPGQYRDCHVLDHLRHRHWMRFISPSVTDTDTMHLFPGMIFLWIPQILSSHTNPAAHSPLSASGSSTYYSTGFPPQIKVLPLQVFLSWSMKSSACQPFFYPTISALAAPLSLLSLISLATALLRSSLDITGQPVWHDEALRNWLVLCAYL